MSLAWLLIIPLALALVAGTVPWTKFVDMSSFIGYAAICYITGHVIHAHFHGIVVTGLSPLFHYDALSLLALLIVSVVGLAGAFYSPPFVRADIRRHSLKPFKYRKFFILYHLLFFAMMLLILSDNMGIMWVAIEGTTLISAVLVSFNNRTKAVEAAWRYLLICSIGIAFALLGTILTYYASVQGGSGTLSWQGLAAMGSKLDPHTMKLAFLCLLLGYGTKAGLVPMSRWKPRTYGTAPSPVSAVMSGALVACAMYMLARLSIVSSGTLGTATVSYYYIFFGVVSIVFSAPMIIAENDIKRLFAYSSIEHVGIITVGLGFGSFFGIYGAFLHLINNAFVKTAMYLSAGNIIGVTGKKDIRRYSCVVQAFPVAGLTVFGAIIATTGTPPFALFLSEYNILKAGIVSDHPWAAGAIIFVLLVVFASFYAKFLHFCFGHSKPDETGEALPRVQQIVPAALLVVVLLIGAIVPTPIHRLLVESAALLGAKP